MKTSTLVSSFLLLLIFGLSQQLHSDETPPRQDLTTAEPASESKDEVKKIEVTITPTEPYLLPDKSTKLLIKKAALHENRMQSGFPQLTNKDLTLDIVPNTVIASGGYLFHLTMPHEYQFGHIRESDMVFTVVDSCKSLVLSEKRKAPVLQLKHLKGTLRFDCDNRKAHQLKSIHGIGNHFVGLRVGRTEIYKRHPSPVLGTGMDVVVVTNFGTEKIRLEYMEPQTVTIEPQRITVESVNFDYPAKWVDVKVRTLTKYPEADAFIVEYGHRTVDVPPAGDVEIKQNGQWKPAKLPLAGLAGGKAVEVRVRGTLKHGMMAIGGETTGTIIGFGKTTWELDLHKHPTFRPRAEKLDGKHVVVTGTVREKAGIEIAKRTILTIESIAPAKD